MKITELRIGNWLYTQVPDMELSEPHLSAKVSAITFADEILFNSIPNHEGVYVNINYVEGIKLDKEWLNKLGFVLKKHKWSDDSISDDLYFYGKYMVGMYDGYSIMGRIGDNGNLQPLSNIDYVHQLQNLYFALTNTELPS